MTSTLLRHLSRDLFDIRLCLFKDVIEFPLPDDVSVARLLDRDISLGARPWLVPGALVGLGRELRESRPDIVLSVIDQANLLVAAALVGARSKARWIARAGANPESQSSVQRRLARWAYRRADSVIANSAGLARDLAALYSGAADRITHLANPIDFDALEQLASAAPAPARDPSMSLIVSVGRLVKEKRPELLVDVAAALKCECSFQLWICGDGPMMEPVRDRVRALGVEDEVRLLGFCDNPYTILAQADAFVMTSEHEGLPNALIEAQGLGVPAVSTDCRYGPNEIIEHGKTGFLVPDGDVRAVSKSLLALLSNEPQRIAMGEAAAERSRSRYGVDELVPRWERLLAG